MYLILGSHDDECAVRVERELERRGEQARLIPNPAEHPSRLVWKIDNGQMTSAVRMPDGRWMAQESIRGVFVRNRGVLDASGWSAGDVEYAQAESQAALLGWLSSLRCPVVNRYPADLWFRPKPTLLYWSAAAHDAGLPVVDTLITTIDSEARAFGEQLLAGGAPGVVYAPLTSDTRYLLRAPADWARLSAMFAASPVCLTAPHGRARFGCVIGRRVVWDERGDAATMGTLEPALRRFGALAGLSFFSFAIADSCQGLAVVHIEPWPSLDPFGTFAQDAIVTAIADLLMSRTCERARVAPVRREARR